MLFGFLLFDAGLHGGVTRCDDGLVLAGRSGSGEGYGLSGVTTVITLCSASLQRKRMHIVVRELLHQVLRAHFKTVPA